MEGAMEDLFKLTKAVWGLAESYNMTILKLLMDDPTKENMAAAKALQNTFRDSEKLYITTMEEFEKKMQKMRPN